MQEMNPQATWAQKPMSATSWSSELARRCILVVDDDEEMREAVGLLLSPTYQLRYAVDGIDGCDKANELPRPDLIIAGLSVGTFAYLSKTAAPGVLEGKVRRALGG